MHSVTPDPVHLLKSRKPWGKVPLFTDNLTYKEGEQLRMSIMRDMQLGVDLRYATAPFKGVENMKLSFGGSCSDTFTEPAASRRDLLLFAYKESDEDFFVKTAFTLSSIRPVMPSVTVKILAFGPLFDRSKKLFAEIDAEIIHFDKYSNYSIVNSRFIAAHDYLSNNIRKFHRVIFSDIKDVFFFNDPFIGLKASSLRLTSECFNFESTNCIHIDDNVVGEWFLKFYDQHTMTWFLNNEFKYINAGTLHGGIHIMVKFLKKFTDLFNKKFINEWGYDQTLLNVEYYRGNLGVDGLFVKGADHNFCFLKKEISEIYLGQNEEGYYLEDGCTPLMIHQGIPDSWYNYK